jgi:hypothetical protein
MENLEGRLLMAQLLTKRENVQKQDKETIDILSIADWDFFLYSYWLKKIALNPQFYDDAKTDHGHCRCCSRVTSEGRKR